MARPARLDSARAWIAQWTAAERQVKARDFAARYGVDRYTAYQEMTILGLPIPPDDERYAVRPPPRPRVRRRAAEPEPSPPQIIEWCGHLIMVMGWTEGGAPHGLGQDELEDIFSPEEVDELCGDPF